VLENELKYYNLAVRINRGDDVATSSKNLVNFWTVTAEMTGLICECQVRHGQKTGVRLSNISGYTGSICAIFSPYERALRADDESVPYFTIYRGTAN